MVTVFFQPINALLTVSSVNALLLYDALRKVPSESVDVKFIDPKLQVALHKFPGVLAPVVPIVKPLEGVRCA